MTSIEWRPIPDFPGYSININGQIKRAARAIETSQGPRIIAERKICHQRHKCGIAVSLCAADGIFKWRGVGPILLDVWGNEPKPESDFPLYCAARDGDKHNIELSNLHWLSRGKIKQLANANGRRK